MEELSRAAGLLADKASPWVVDLSLLALGVGVMIFALTQLGQKLGMFARDIAGNGATPGQVRAITEQALDRKINGNFGDIKDQLAALQLELVTQRRENDKRHADNQRELGELHGQLTGMARRA